MKLKDLKQCYIYSPIKTKKDGEIVIKWQYKEKYLLNVQQDLNELDTNEAGVVDYDRIKIRTDYDINIEKGDGVSLEKLELRKNFSITPPKYKVIAKPKVGNTTTYTCDIYHGE